jgi:hypothetical protein
VHVAIFVHRVAGLHPGPYLLARAQERLQPLAEAMRPEWLWQEVEGCPVHLPLRFLYPHDSRAIAKLVSCHQNIAADGAFSLSMLAEFSCIGEDCPWEYRRLFWEAGMLGHTLYLEAEAAGMRATGIGCYFDDEMHRVLGLKNICFQSFYHASVGGPLEDGRLTTLPAYAHLEHG